MIPGSVTTNGRWAPILRAANPASASDSGPKTISGAWNLMMPPGVRAGGSSGPAEWS